MKTTAPAVLLPADIGFAMSVDSWLSKTIAWFMGSRWSHTFMIAGSMHGQDMTVETSDYEVYAAPMIDHYGPRKRTAIYRCKVLDDETRKAIVLKSMSHIGETYGYLQLLSLGLRRLLMRAGIRIPNFFRQGLVCCAVPLYGYKESTVHPLSIIDPESIDTEELYQIISNSPHFELIYEQDP
jgi:hypothetical protein